MEIIQDRDKALEVMHNVGTWMFDTGISSSDWWNPQNMNEEFMSQHTEPDEYFVIVIGGKPAASVILQDNERNLSWEPIDGKDKKEALYVHWVAVHRDFKGQSLSHMLLDFAAEQARKLGFDRVRLDTDADNQMLMSLYKNYGFKVKGIETEDDGHKVAYFELIL